MANCGIQLFQAHVAIFCPRNNTTATASGKELSEKSFHQQVTLLDFDDQELNERRRNVLNYSPDRDVATTNSRTAFLLNQSFRRKPPILKSGDSTKASDWSGSRSQSLKHSLDAVTSKESNLVGTKSLYRLKKTCDPVQKHEFLRKTFTKIKFSKNVCYFFSDARSEPSTFRVYSRTKPCRTR